MEVNVPVIGESWDLEEVLHLLVDASFYQWLMIINALKVSLHAKEIFKKRSIIWRMS